MCFKCDEEEHTADYQQQDASEDIENEEEAGTSDDVDLVIHCAMDDFTNIEKSGHQSLDKH